MTVLAFLKLSLKLLITLVLGYCMYLAGSASLASVNYYAVKNVLDDFPNQSPSRMEYIQTKAAAERTLALHKDLAFYRDVYGELIQWGLYYGFEDQNSVYPSLIKNYQESIKLRPTWPTTWANLALIKWELRELDDEFLYYVEQADKFGHATPEVHVAMVRLGYILLKNNLSLYIKLNGTISEHLKNGLVNRFSRQNVLTVINNNGIGIACTWAKQAEDLESKYSKALKCR